jgi:hypothetical protein
MVAGYPRKRRLKMVLDPTNTNQFRTFIKDAKPEDLVTIAPLLFSRIGTLEQSYQERLIQEVQADPQAKRVFEKMHSFTS